LSRPDKAAAECVAVNAAQRDPSRFAELYEGNFELVYAFVARRAQGHEEAEDITAEVFHRALANLARFRWRGVPFAAWLLKIAANAINDNSKRLRRERQPFLAAEPAHLDRDDTEERARLFRLVDRLPARRRHESAPRSRTCLISRPNCATFLMPNSRRVWRGSFPPRGSLNRGARRAAAPRRNQRWYLQRISPTRPSPRRRGKTFCP
jgi:Sigma-70 region 2